MKLSRKIWLSLLAITFALGAYSTPSAYAIKFANQFTEFELPPQWQCNLEGAEWVCQSTVEAKKRDAIIVLAAKIKGDQDSMEQYEAYLKAPKSFQSVQGKPVKSDPKYAKMVNINGQAWVDALHMESEIPGFYTRYLATVKEDIGVLVTYSINKAKYQAYLEDFENMVKTLKVFRKPGINAAPQSSDLFKVGQIPPSINTGTVFGDGGQIAGGSDQPAKKPQQQDNSMVLIIIAVGVVGFIIWKRKRGRADL